jgi:putative integral membrane protein (TIGR02587 family)
MEVWWAGFIATPGRILGYLGFILVLLLGYNRYAGIRYDASWAEVVIDSIEELGLGIVTAAGALFLLGQIGPEHSLGESLGKTLVEAGLVAIGFSVGTSQLGAEAEEERGAAGEEDETPTFRSQIVIAFCGAFLFAANVAPTEEIVLIAVETPPGRLIGLALASAGIAMLILYFSDFVKSRRIVRVESTAQVAAGTIVTYAVALVASAVILWYFGRFDGVSLDVCVRQTVVLGFPAVLGASAGRLILHR